MHKDILQRKQRKIAVFIAKKEDKGLSYLAAEV